jgi:polo-like kinase 1
MNNYTFPDNALISDFAKDLIRKILVLDPIRRLSLDEILSHSFMNNAGSIPRNLPLSTLEFPPSVNFIKQYLPAN